MLQAQLHSNRIVIQVFGSGFTSITTRCYIDGSVLPLTAYINETLVECTVTRSGPMHTDAAVQLYSSTLQQASTQTATFTFDEPPTLYSVQPSSVQIDNDTVLTIDGSGFIASSQLTCRFDMNSSLTVAASYIDDYHVQCILTESIKEQFIARNIALQIANDAIHYSNDVLQVAVLFDPANNAAVQQETLISISPTHAAMIQGATIQVTMIGTNFQSTPAPSQCVVEGSIAPTIYINSTTLICTVERVGTNQSDATLQVYSTIFDSTSSDYLTFTFDTLPSLASVSPSTVQIDNDTLLQLESDEFIYSPAPHLLCQ
jgi:hypothetical protein